VVPLALATNLPPDVAAALAARPAYPQLFAAAFGDPAITARRIAFALASYERTLNPNQTPFDQNTLTPQQQAGRQLFFNVGCAACHQPPLFSDRSFRFLGLRPASEDIGRQAVTNDPGDAGRMKVPSLRNVALRSRWFHNGQAASLDDVLNFYDNPGPPLPGRDPRIRPLGLNQNERASIVAFLGALTDARVAAGTGPFTRPTLWTERNAPGAELYGGGGGGTGGLVPQLFADLPANVGNADYRFGVGNALGGVPSVLALGSAEPPAATRVLGAPLHVDLSGAMLLPRLLRGTGAGGGFDTVPLPLPADPALRGAELRVQWLVLDGGGSAPLAATSGARARVF
jgi:hypothetical protein